jgi:cytochrome c oxidase subunit 3
MWTFLITEVMFFGALFTAYVYGFLPSRSRRRARTNWKMGGFNARADRVEPRDGARDPRRSTSRRGVQLVNVVLTMIFGLTFLVVKYFSAKWHHHLMPARRSTSRSSARGPQARIFFPRSTSR